VKRRAASTVARTFAPSLCAGTSTQKRVAAARGGKTGGGCTRDKIAKNA